METKRKRKPPLEKRGVFEQWLLEKRGVFEQWLLEEPLAGRVAYNDKSLITNFTVLTNQTFDNMFPEIDLISLMCPLLFNFPDFPFNFI